MKASFRFSVLVALIVCCVAVLFAQTAMRDVVYLKNGGIIRGIIIETVPNTSIKIQTADGSIFIYNFSDIDKYGKEMVSEDAAQKSSAPAASGSSSAFSIFAGANIPMGDFASTSFDNANAGFAKTSFSAGLQFVSGGSVGIVISALYAVNGIDDRSNGIDDVFKISGNWQSIMTLLGLKIGTSNATGVNFFVAPLVGINFSKSPPISIELSDYPPCSGYYNGYLFTGNIYVDGILTASNVSTLTPAYGVMMELDMGSITLGARYIVSKPKYDYTATGTMSGMGSLYSAAYGGYQTFSFSESAQYINTLEQPTAILIAYLGIAF